MNNQLFRQPLSWSAAAIAIILVFFAYALVSILSTFFSQGSTSGSVTKNEQLIETYNNYIAKDIERFNGRSAFYLPIRIAPPSPPAPEKKEVIPEPMPPVIPEEPKPIPPPPTYTGPPLIAIIGQEAWFRGSGSGNTPVIRLKVGEEQNGLKLIETMPPAQVIVKHRRGEYPINLFDYNETFFRQDPPPVAVDSFLEEVDG